MTKNTYIVVEHPITDFEQITVGSDGQPIKHGPTVEEYKGSLPDYLPGPVGTATARERRLFEANPQRYAGKPVTRYYRARS